MSTLAAPAKPFTLAFDSLKPATLGAARALWGFGCRGACGYLETMTRAYVDMLHGIGFWVLPLTEARAGALSAARGTTEGTASADRALKLGVPMKTHIIIDSESTTGSGVDVSGYDDAFAASLGTFGYQAGLYAGADQPLTGVQVYSLAHVNMYFRAAGYAMPEPACGWGQIQLFPLNQRLAAIIPGYTGEGASDVYDLSVVQTDFRGRSPYVWLP